MKIIPTRRSKAGSTTLIILILMSLMAIFVMNNNRSLHQLKQEMNLVEQKQLQKWVARTNAFPTP